MNQKGMSTLIIIMFVAAGMLSLFATLLTSARQTANKRSVTRRQITAQEISENAAVLIYQSYQTYKMFGACPPQTALATAEGVNFCLPQDPASCIANPDDSSNDICFSRGNVSVRDFIALNVILPNLNERVASHAESPWRKIGRVEFGLSQAFAAEAADVNSLPNIAAAPYAAFTAGQAPVGGGAAVTCNNGGASLVCVNARICVVRDNLVTWTCADADAIYQRVGFPR